MNRHDQNENPFQSPESVDRTAVGVLSGQLHDLKAVALYQKGIITCILLYVIVFSAQLVMFSRVENPLLSMMFGILLILVGLIGTIFVFLLAIKVYGQGIGILLGVFALIPCVGLLVLLRVNHKATTIMRSNGVTVGLFGADMSHFLNA